MSDAADHRPNGRLRQEKASLPHNFTADCDHARAGEVLRRGGVVIRHENENPAETGGIGRAFEGRHKEPKETTPKETMMSGLESNPSSAAAQASRTEKITAFWAEHPDLEFAVNENGRIVFRPEPEPEPDASIIALTARLGGTVDASGVGRNCECQNCGERTLIIRRGTKKANQPLVVWCEGCKVPSDFLIKAIAHGAGLRLDRPEPLPEPPAEIVASLSPYARTILMELIAVAQRSPDVNGDYALTYLTIIEKLGIRRRSTIASAIVELERAGLIVIKRIVGRNVPGKPRLNRYGLTFIPRSDEARPVTEQPPTQEADNIQPMSGNHTRYRRESDGTPPAMSCMVSTISP